MVSDPVAVALIGMMGLVLVALIGLWGQQKATHQLVNSRMTEMLAITKAASRDEGRLKGEEDQRIRQSPPVVEVPLPENQPTVE